MHVALWLIGIYLAVGIVWAIFVAVFAAGQGDPLSAFQFFTHLAMWPYEIARLVGARW